MKTITKEFAEGFKLGYDYKMGGTQTLVFPNGQEFEFDDREYYSGRGSKYNSSIRHDIKGRIAIDKKSVSIQLKHDREAAKRRKDMIKAMKEKKQRYEEFRSKGLYEINNFDYGTFVNLSDEESCEKTFDAERLAKTLDISVNDARLLNSGGKTYVFAEQKSTGRVIELYHSSLSCNNLSISISYPSKERVAEFNADRKNWENAPYAGMVGMTENQNHFVC